MGFQTEITFGNDAAHELEDKKNQKKFCEDLHNAIVDGSDAIIAIGSHANYVKVKKTHHADDVQCYFAGFNDLSTFQEIIKYIEKLDIKGFDNYCPPRIISNLEWQCKDMLAAIKEFKQRIKKRK